MADERWLVDAVRRSRSTDEDAPEGASVYKKMSTFLIEKPAGFGEVLPGLTIPGKIDKMGYKGRRHH